LGLVRSVHASAKHQTLHHWLRELCATPPTDPEPMELSSHSPPLASCFQVELQTVQVVDHHKVQAHGLHDPSCAILSPDQELVTARRLESSSCTEKLFRCAAFFYAHTVGRNAKSSLSQMRFPPPIRYDHCD